MARRPLRLAHILAAIALPLAGPALAAAAAPSAHKTQRAVHHTKVHHHVHRTVRHASAVHSAMPPAGVTATAPSSAAPAAAPAAQPAPTSCANGDLVPTSANVDLIRVATICLINMERAASGVGQLNERPNLDAAAAAHTQDMIARDYFDHVGPTGVGLLDRVVGSGYATVGSVLGLAENIAAASGSLATPGATVASWMSSPEHRANILDASYTDTGVGVLAALPPSVGLGSAGATYTQVFGASST